MKNIALAVLSVGLCFYGAYRVDKIHRLNVSYPMDKQYAVIDYIASAVAIGAAIGVFIV